MKHELPLTNYYEEIKCNCPNCPSNNKHISKRILVNQTDLWNVLTSTLDTLLMYEVAIQRNRRILTNAKIKEYITKRVRNIDGIIDVVEQNELVRDKSEQGKKIKEVCERFIRFINGKEKRIRGSKKDATDSLRYLQSIQELCVDFFEISPECLDDEKIDK